MPKTPIIMVCMHRQTEAFTILRYVEDKRYCTDIGHGPFIRLTREEMRLTAVRTLSKCFKEYLMADRAEESEIKRMSDEEKRRFESEHKLLSVYLVNNAKLWLEPMRVTKPGWKGHVGLGERHRVGLDWPTTDHSLFEALLNAFSRAP